MKMLLIEALAAILSIVAGVDFLSYYATKFKRSNSTILSTGLPRGGPQDR
jgi:hypothetical protein